jgi:hypothetical protein
MKKFYILLTATLIMISYTAATGAATISISPTGTYAMTSGDTMNFDVLFTADGDGDTLTGATLSLGYDATELTFLSYATPLGWEEFFGPVQDVTLESGSYLANYNQNYPWDGSPIDVAANQSVSLGTFTFEATAGLAADGLSDLWVVDEVEVNGLTYFSIISYNDSYGEYASTLLTAQGADVAPVPVPAAAWLLGSGLLGLIGIRGRMI